MYGAGAPVSSNAEEVTPTGAPGKPFWDPNPKNAEGAPRDVATAMSEPMHTVNTAYFTLRRPPSVLRPWRATSGVASSARRGSSTEFISLHTREQRGFACVRAVASARSTRNRNKLFFGDRRYELSVTNVDGVLGSVTFFRCHVTRRLVLSLIHISEPTRPY